MSFPFVVEQVSFPRRAIVLQGQSLPHQGVAWGGTQRAQFTWFPGNPVAVIQVIGPTYTPTRILGKWKDIKLFDPENSPRLLNFPAITPAATAAGAAIGGQTFTSAGSVPTQLANRARAVRDAFTMIRKEGVLLKVEWGSIVRFGLITADEFPHDREEDIDFDIEFTWSGDTANQPSPKLPLPSVPGLLQALLALLDQILNTLLTALFAAQLWLTRVTQLVTRLGSFITELLGILEDLVGLVFTPQQIRGTVLSSLRAIKLAANDLRDELDRGQTAAIEAALSGDPVLVNLNNLLQGELRSQAQQIAAEAALAEQRIREAISPELRGVYISPGSVTLREVSQRFYGTADNWRVIADFNGFGGSILPRGTIVRVPTV